MDTIEAIHSRRSIRKYLNKPIPEDVVTQLVAAAMAAPSARNLQSWEFVIITEKKILDKIPSINAYAQMAAEAPLAILVCGNLETEPSTEYCSINCAAATQNLLLCAHALGLGAVWTGSYPNEGRMDGYTELLGLPKHILPHSLVVLGYPHEEPPAKERFKPERIHNNGW